MNTQLIANTYASDGVVFIPNVLTPATLACAEEAYWSLANPGDIVIFHPGLLHSGQARYRRKFR